MTGRSGSFFGFFVGFIVYLLSLLFFGRLL